MMIISKVMVPESVKDGQGTLLRRNGKVVAYERGSVANVYIFHEDTEEGTRAMELKVPIPITRAKCINAAEMAAYGLNDAMDVASFASSLGRKERKGEDIEEVQEHDAFIGEVKEELTALGIL